MITKIKVKENTRAAQILMFREIDFSSLPNLRIVPLFGANGAGKTTLMKGIEETIHYQRELLTAEKMKREEPEDEDLYEMIAQTCRNKKSLDISGDETPIVLFRNKARILVTLVMRGIAGNSVLFVTARHQIRHIKVSLLIWRIGYAFDERHALPQRH